MKRINVRAIIIVNESIVSMYREFNNRVFYTFPGGGLDGWESEEECVKREVFEEFGLKIKPIKKVYIYENEKSTEHIYVCDIVGGEFGRGEGEEYKNNKNGVYTLHYKNKRNQTPAIYAFRTSTRLCCWLWKIRKRLEKWYFIS